jgi:hypothetical protein
MKLKERKIARASLLVALAVAALIIAATRVRESQARAPGPAVAAVRPDPGPAEVPSSADDSSEIVGQIEPLLVGSPSPHRAVPGRSTRR